MGAVLCAAAAALALASTAAAGGGRYEFDGGSPDERETVQTALDASAFPWDLVPAPVVVEIREGAVSRAVPGRIVLDAAVLGTGGSFAWGLVQHEYAHQVDFLVLTPAQRAVLAAALGAEAWWDSRLPHGARGAERFASLVAWAYWPSERNIMRPLDGADAAAAMRPAEFRALLASLLGVPDTLTRAVARRVVATVRFLPR
jgi:hypothetical protein